MSEIRIIEAPSVYLIGRQAVDEAELARFLADDDSPGWTTDAPSAGERLVETAGRLCYDSFRKPRPGGNAAYVGHILEVGHGSVVEHCVFTVLITGVSRTLTHELIRHRVGLSPSQLSQRFVDESDCAFVVPPAYLKSVADATHYIGLKGGDMNIAHIHSLDDELDDETREGLQWIRCVHWSLQTYKELASRRTAGLQATYGDATARRKAAREAARSVLPGCVETKIALTGNARAWRHALEMRGSAQADAEIRRLALALLEVFQHAAPNLFGDYETPTVDGIRRIQTPHRKV